MPTEIYEIEATERSPRVYFNPKEGLLEIGGISILENSMDFFYGLNRALSDYSFNPAINTTVNLKFEYVNSSTILSVTRLLNTIDKMIGLRTSIEINWYFDKEDLEMKELGQFYDELMKCKINLIEVEDI